MTAWHCHAIPEAVVSRRSRGYRNGGRVCEPARTYRRMEHERVGVVAHEPLGARVIVGGEDTPRGLLRDDRRGGREEAGDEDAGEPARTVWDARQHETSEGGTRSYRFRQRRGNVLLPSDRVVGDWIPDRPREPLRIGLPRLAHAVEILHRIRGERQVRRRKVVLQLLGTTGANQDGRHRWTREQPGQRHGSRGGADGGRDLLEHVHGHIAAMPVDWNQIETAEASAAARRVLARILA